VRAEAKQTPVVASGGIGNGEGIRKVLTAGASGAMLGTRFVATQESWARPDYKAALTQAKASDTARLCASRWLTQCVTACVIGIRAMGICRMSAGRQAPW
jgi:NAD(P)H-dependent flavin oxidoreductase YrpB (nitropropane dioxygenase family)